MKEVLNLGLIVVQKVATLRETPKNTQVRDRTGTVARLKGKLPTTQVQTWRPRTSQSARHKTHPPHPTKDTECPGELTPIMKSFR